jgi:7-cyano-7-deazaguanine synthase in queuosine biosynthesis
VLWDLLQREDVEVSTVTITYHDQILNHREEARARKRLLREFKKRGHTLHEHTEFEVKLIAGDGLNGDGLPHASLWMLATQALKTDQSLFFGYTRGDDWTRYWSYYRTIFDQLQLVSDRTGVLELPLFHARKRDIIERLEEDKLLRLCWWCELTGKPRKKRMYTQPCGECPSCQRHELALIERTRWPETRTNE